jgi:hypothetical protein
MDVVSALTITSNYTTDHIHVSFLLMAAIVTIVQLLPDLRDFSGDTTPAIMVTTAITVTTATITVAT